MPTWDLERDAQVRAAAIAYVAEKTREFGVITRDQLESFTFEGEQIKLIDQSRGIRNPKQLPATLTILTNPAGPYDDFVGEDGFPRYMIDSSADWAESVNRKLHEAYVLGVPLIWLQKVRSGVFVATAPVYLDAPEPEAGHYSVALDEALLSAHRSATPLEAAYATRVVKQRLHQPAFRARVMHAYRERCAVCSLQRHKLLDAAHITADSDARGTPETSNGLALCKIHHAAFDSNVIGIRPDLVVQVSAEVLADKDGPMLTHGLQAFHGRRLMVVPASRRERPDADRLEERFQQFFAAG